MDAAYLSAFAALAGSAIGGLTSLAASWLTQREQVSAQQLAHDIGRREELYKDFIEEASKSFADAIEHSEVDAAKIVRLYALVSRMRILSAQRVVEQADKVIGLIMERYAVPNKTIREVADELKARGLDPLRDFSEACRGESGRRSELSERMRS
jgi:hypothetical protein